MRADPFRQLVQLPVLFSKNVQTVIRVHRNGCPYSKGVEYESFIARNACCRHLRLRADRIATGGTADADLKCRLRSSSPAGR